MCDKMTQDFKTKTSLTFLLCHEKETEKGTWNIRKFSKLNSGCYKKVVIQSH